jgi:flagellar biosynthetic protein FliR
MDRWMALSPSDVPVFLLAFFRVTGVVMLAPLFGSGVMAPNVRALLSLVLAVVFFPLVGRPETPIEPSLGVYAVAVLEELGLGLLLGFAASMVFAAVQFGGQIIDQELGVMMANILDPLTDEQISIIGQFKLFLATVVYLLLDGHHQLLRALADSFRTIPITGMRLSPGAVLHVSDTMMRDLFRIAVQIAAPSLVTLFLITVALAFMARTVPEMNIFVLGFSLRVGVGLVVLAVGIGIFVYGLDPILRRDNESVTRFLNLLGG